MTLAGFAGVLLFALVFGGRYAAGRSASWLISTRRTITVREVAASVYVFGIGMCMVGFAGYDAFRAVSPPFGGRPEIFSTLAWSRLLVLFWC